MNTEGLYGSRQGRDNRNPGDVVSSRAVDMLPHRRLMGEGKTCGDRRECHVENGLLGKGKAKFIIHPRCGKLD